MYCRFLFALPKKRRVSVDQTSEHFADTKSANSTNMSDAPKPIVISLIGIGALTTVLCAIAFLTLSALVAAYVYISGIIAILLTIACTKKT